ncbi:MAG TPA: GFA family protein [Sphingomonas sp.]|nr:GFA family protein [Sphingomonas sp.]
MTGRVASCSCGRLRLTCAGEPVRISICHCLECQKRTGSVFATQARFSRASVRIGGETDASPIAASRERADARPAFKPTNGGWRDEDPVGPGCAFA